MFLTRKTKRYYFFKCKISWIKKRFQGCSKFAHLYPKSVIPSTIIQHLRMILLLIVGKFRKLLVRSSAVCGKTFAFVGNIE